MKKFLSALGLVAALSTANLALANPVSETVLEDAGDGTRDEMLSFLILCMLI